MFKTFDLNTKSVTETKQNLSKYISEVNETSEPLFILSHNKPEAVLLSNESYEKLVHKYQALEEQLHNYEVSRRIKRHDAQNNPTTYTSDELGIDLSTTEWSDDDGWE